MAQNWVLVLTLSKQNAVPDGLGSVHHSVSVSSATREAAPRKVSNSMPIARTRTKCFIAVSSLAAGFVSKLLAGLPTEGTPRSVVPGYPRADCSMDETRAGHAGDAS
jgi:hypothetical protein